MYIYSVIVCLTTRPPQHVRQSQSQSWMALRMALRKALRKELRKVSEGSDLLTSSKL